MTPMPSPEVQLLSQWYSNVIQAPGGYFDSIKLSSSAGDMSEIIIIQGRKGGNSLPDAGIASTVIHYLMGCLGDEILLFTMSTKRVDSITETTRVDPENRRLISLSKR
jgi:hypothetical protein